MAEITPISLEKVKSYPLEDRLSKVNADSFGKSWTPGGSITQWLESLPKILAGNDLRQVVDSIVRAAASDKTIILAMGAHPIKVGLNPIILDMMDRGVISGVLLESPATAEFHLIGDGLVAVLACDFIPGSCKGDAAQQARQDERCCESQHGNAPFRMIRRGSTTSNPG